MKNSTQLLKIGLVAGEASGDKLGAALIEALRPHLPEARFVGVAGPRMQALGAESWFPMERLSVHGLVEVVRHLPGLWKLRKALIRRMQEEGVALCVGIDAPDFTLGMERALKQSGMRTIHFVSPSVWAWRRGRIPKIGASAHRVLALFPFEPSLYEAYGVPVTYVGHPAAQHAADEGSRARARAALQLTGNAPVFALLPGSRMSELKHHTVLLVETAQRIRQALPEARFLVPMVSPEARARFETLRMEGTRAEVPLTLIDGRAEEILQAADVGLVASGTATLEAALARCPHIIFYRGPAITVWIVKRMLEVPWVGLPNVLAQRFIAPELMQEAATPEALADEALALYRDEPRRREIETAFAEMAQTLKADTGALAAEAVLEELAAVIRDQRTATRDQS
ncbi:MAG: lipid-A-disaccharide synthase [Burkholderiales bacterium]|jgi:lipid-A-disaccharide synthase|nr:lipid-A-disaccharide synthase [Burkholderiales bacterium]